MRISQKNSGDIIDLANKAKGLMDKNQKSSVQQELESLFQELESLFPGRRGGGRGGERKELHRVGAGKSSASTITDTIPQNEQL